MAHKLVAAFFSLFVPSIHEVTFIAGEAFKKQKIKIKSETVNLSTHWLQDALYSIWFSSIIHCLKFFRRSMFKMSLTIWKFVLIQFGLNIYGAHSVPICAYWSFPSINRCILFFVFSERLTTFIASVFSEVVMNNILLKLQAEIRGFYTASRSKDQQWWFLTGLGFILCFKWADSLSEWLLQAWHCLCLVLLLEQSTHINQAQQDRFHQLPAPLSSQHYKQPLHFWAGRVVDFQGFVDVEESTFRLEMNPRQKCSGH